MKYLRSEQYYTDLYDLLTIKDCLSSIEFFSKSFQEKAKDKNGSEHKKKKACNVALNLDLWARKGEEYRNKSTRIQEWIERDQKIQEKYDNTSEPQGIYCSACGETMYSTFKHLEDYMDKPFRVLFFFECPTCKKRRGIYDNGDEKISNPTRCPKCNSLVEEKHTIKGKGRIITWITICHGCGFTEKTVDDFEKSHAEFEKKEQEDKELLKKYRKEFCLSDEEGQKYISYTTQLKTAMDFLKKAEGKQKDPAYQAVKRLKKLSVVELEKLLSGTLEKEKYIKLNFDKPEMDRFVVIPFTVQEADLTRKEYDSIHILQKIIKKLLEDTNWRLMSEGISYRLGYAYGRLKGYEREDDIIEIVRQKK